ncbi:MAG: GspE/PulE family protein, partial [Acidimicrobiia bacterium]
MKLRKSTKSAPFETTLPSMDLTPAGHESDASVSAAELVDATAAVTDHREAVQVLRQMMNAVDQQLSADGTPVVSSANGSGGGSAPIIAAPRPRRVGGRQMLGEILEAKGILTHEQINDALLELVSTGKRLGAFLVEAGLIDEQILAAALAEQYGLHVADLRHEAPNPEAITTVTEKMARELSVIPFRCNDRQIAIVVADPTQPGLASTLGEVTGRQVTLMLAPASDIRRAIETSYKATAKVDEAVRAFETLKIERVIEETPKAVVDENAPIVQVVTLILEQAVRDRASDVHIEPAEDCVRIRFRIDGALKDVVELPAEMAPALVSR